MLGLCCISFSPLKLGVLKMPGLCCISFSLRLRCVNVGCLYLVFSLINLRLTIFDYLIIISGGKKTIHSQTVFYRSREIHGFLCLAESSNLLDDSEWIREATVALDNFNLGFKLHQGWDHSSTPSMPLNILFTSETAMPRLFPSHVIINRCCLWI